MLTEEEKNRLRKLVHDAIWRELAGYASRLAPAEHWGLEWERLYGEERKNGECPSEDAYIIYRREGNDLARLVIVPSKVRRKIEASGLCYFNEMMREILKARKRAFWREDQQRRRDRTVELDDESIVGESDVQTGEDILIGLTERERQVVEMLLLGYSQKEIAAELGISPQRMNRIVKSIKEKLLTE
ncbi:MAG: helix-turn-helix transcriptional regulator [Chloroflexi bacterium]|nr:helix-turn-helix transcriptional regulator [Chloroflexota bacterium]